MDAAAQYALAYALTTTAGLRGFLTLLAAAIAIHLGWLHVTPAFAWLGSNGSMIVLSVFTLLEFAADKIPAVDHAMHVLHTAVRPVAAAMLVGGTVHTDNTAELSFLMGLGALNALLVHGTSVTARGASTLTTGGFANIVLSFLEDAIAVGGVLLALIKPILAALISLAFVIALIFLWRWALGRRTARQA